MTDIASTTAGLMQERLRDLPRQLREARLAIGLCLAAASAILGGCLTLHVARDVPFRALMQDPTAYLGGQAYVGVVSQLGIMIWVAAAATCLFGAFIAHRAGRSGARFLLASGALSGFLGADDLLQLHEDILPLAGVPQTAVLACYAALGLAYLAAFRRDILALNPVLLALSCGFLGLSLAIDLVFAHGDVQTFAEDGAKLVGILFWGAFFVVSAATICDPQGRGNGSLWKA